MNQQSEFPVCTVCRKDIIDEDEEICLHCMMDVTSQDNLREFTGKVQHVAELQAANTGLHGPETCRKPGELAGRIAEDPENLYDYFDVRMVDTDGGNAAFSVKRRTPEAALPAQGLSPAQMLQQNIL